MGREKAVKETKLMSEWRTQRDKKQDEVIYKNEIKTESELTKIKERDKQLSVKDFKSEFNLKDDMKERKKEREMFFSFNDTKMRKNECVWIVKDGRNRSE